MLNTIISKIKNFIDNLYKALSNRPRLMKMFNTINSCFRTGKRLKIQVFSIAIAACSFKAIIPLFAFVFAVTGGLGLDSCVEKWVSHLLTNIPESLEQIMECAKELKEATTSVIAITISFIVLTKLCFGVYNNVYKAFVSIWEKHVSHNKIHGWMYKFITTMILVIIIPVAIIIMNIGIVFLTPIENYISSLIGIYSINHVINYIVMFLIITGMLTLMYKTLPPVKVESTHSFISALIASIIFMTIQVLYLKLQILIFGINPAYGILSTPIFYLVWLITSWWIILAGAVICFTLEYPEEYEAVEPIFSKTAKYSHKMINRLKRKISFPQENTVQYTTDNRSPRQKSSTIPVSIHRKNIKCLAKNY